MFEQFKTMVCYQKKNNVMEWVTEREDCLVFWVCKFISFKMGKEEEMNQKTKICAKIEIIWIFCVLPWKNIMFEEN